MFLELLGQTLLYLINLMQIIMTLTIIVLMTCRVILTVVQYTTNMKQVLIKLMLVELLLL
ncbi:MAG: hypothetical protein CMK80_00190 [Pseudomonadales bacterium]|nr:hypothetical protein [Pseudomonadales bacterium]